jgi:hypothetical protein
MKKIWKEYKFPITVLLFFLTIAIIVYLLVADDNNYPASDGSWAYYLIN